MTLGNIIASAAFAVLVLWVIFVILMRLKHKRERRGELKTHEKIIAAILYPPGIILDVVVNFTLGIIIFWEVVPWTVSDRMDLYVQEDRKFDPIRKWIVRELAEALNDVDPGHVG